MGMWGTVGCGDRGMWGQGGRECGGWGDGGMGMGEEQWEREKE